MLKSEETQQRDGCLTLKHFSSFVLLAVIFINCLICTIIISKNVVITQENQILLERLVAIASGKCGFSVNPIKNVEIDHPISPEKIIGLYEDIKATTCPPCPTTPRPDPVDTHLNPVMILNEASFNKAQYDCVHSCVHPVIHKAYLTINDSCCTGVTWTGIGASKAASKHHAAYQALHDKFPDRYEEVSESNIPPDYRPTPCQKPTVLLIGESKETDEVMNSQKKPYQKLRELHNPIPIEPMCVQYCGRPRMAKSNFTIVIDISGTTDYFVAYSTNPRSALEKVSYFALEKLYPSSLGGVEKPEDLDHAAPSCSGSITDRIVDCKKTTII